MTDEAKLTPLGLKLWMREDLEKAMDALDYGSPEHCHLEMKWMHLCMEIDAMRADLEKKRLQAKLDFEKQLEGIPETDYGDMVECHQCKTLFPYPGEDGISCFHFCSQACEENNYDA